MYHNVVLIVLSKIPEVTNFTFSTKNWSSSGMCFIAGLASLRTFYYYFLVNLSNIYTNLKILLDHFKFDRSATLEEGRRRKGGHQSSEEREDIEASLSP